MKNPFNNADELFGEKVSKYNNDLKINLKSKKELSYFQKLKSEGHTLSEILNIMNISAGTPLKIHVKSKRIDKVLNVYFEKLDNKDNFERLNFYQTDTIYIGRTSLHRLEDLEVLEGDSW